MPEQEVDPQLIEQTRREINRLVAEVESLAGSDLSPDEFYAEFCRRLFGGLAAQALALWMKTPNGNLQVRFQINLQQVGLDYDAGKKAHEELLRQALTQTRPFIALPYSGAGEGSEGLSLNNPTGFLLVLSPILLDGATTGIIEVFLDPARRATAQQGYLNFVGRLASEVSKYLRNRQFRQIRTEQERWNAIDTYVRTVHGGLNPRQVAYLISNEGKKLIECERLSVALKQGKKAKMLAISGQDVVEKRSNLVQRMGKLAARVIKHGENLVYTGKMEDHWPKDVKTALDRYLEESGSKVVAVVPMKDERDFGVRGKASSALIVEMIEDGNEPSEMGARIEVVGKHGAVALYNALEYHRIPALWLFKWLGNSTEWIHSRTFPKIMAGVLAIALLAVAGFLVPWPLRLEGKGELVPEKRRTVFAPVPGLVDSVKVDHNDAVEEGSLLAEIKNPDVEREILKISGEKASSEEQLRSMRDERAKKPSDAELGGKIEQKAQEVSGLERQLESVKKQQDQLKVVSPISGRVMDWKVKEKLRLKPVQQGDVLMEIAQVDGPWVLEVDFPENTVTHLNKAMAASKDKKVPVTFVLSASPDRTYHGTLIELATQAQSVEQKNIIKGKIAIDPKEGVPQIKGVEVRAKADCGPHPVGYVLLRELIDFIREYVFF